MLRRYKLIILISAMLLVPILVGMIPLNIAHMLASVDHFVHGKQGCCKNHCAFNSLVSHDQAVEALDSTPLGQNLHVSQEIRIPILDGFSHDTVFTSIPLRC